MATNNVTSDQQLRERATRIIIDYFGEMDSKHVVLRELIFDELCGVRNQIPQNVHVKVVMPSTFSEFD